MLVALTFSSIHKLDNSSTCVSQSVKSSIVRHVEHNSNYRNARPKVVILKKLRLNFYFPYATFVY